MKNILILGANGQIAKFAIDLFLKNTDFKLTLFARSISRLKEFKNLDRISLVEGDVQDLKKLNEIMPGHDVIYANLDGDLKSLADNIITAMESASIKRLIFISSMGIYDEVPGQSYKSVLNPYRDAALLIEKTSLDYTIIRPEWLNNKDEIDYEITHRNEKFKKPENWLSRKSVADLIVKLASDPKLYVRDSLGINKP